MCFSFFLVMFCFWDLRVKVWRIWVWFGWKLGGGRWLFLWVFCDDCGGLYMKDGWEFLGGIFFMFDGVLFLLFVDFGFVFLNLYFVFCDLGKKWFDFVFCVVIFLFVIVEWFLWSICCVLNLRNCFFVWEFCWFYFLFWYVFFMVCRSVISRVVIFVKILLCVWFEKLLFDFSFEVLFWYVISRVIFKFFFVVF